MPGEDRREGLGVAGGVRCRPRPVSTIPGRMSLDTGPKSRFSPWELAVAPPPERCDDWSELDPAARPERRERHHAVGRPGEDHFVRWTLQISGVDGHDSHTSVSSASARGG